MDSFESERGTRVDAFVAWDRFRVCVCVCMRAWIAWDGRDQVVTQTWGLHVRFTTTSDDAVIVMRLITMRGSVSVSISLPSRPLLPISLFLATQDTNACHPFLSLSLHLRVSHPRTFMFLSRYVSSLISPAPPTSFFGRDYANVIKTAPINVDMPLLGPVDKFSSRMSGRNLVGVAARSGFKSR